MFIKTIQEKYGCEIALIILCCRHYLQTADINNIENFIEENKIDWKQLYQLSKVHRIRLICYNILLKCKEKIGIRNLEEFRRDCMYLNAVVLNNKKELSHILDLLKQNNIQAKTFKGIDFTERFYGDLGLREFSDNDVIIKVHDIEKVISIMMKEGYQSKDVEFFKKFSRQYVRDYKDLLFEKKNNNIREFAFEFHFKPTRYFQGYSSSFEEILGENFLSENEKINEISYLKLMTLNHGLLDVYPNVRSVLDLAVIYKKAQEINFDQFGIGLKKYLKYGLAISCNLFDYPILKNILSKKEIKSAEQLTVNILKLKNASRLPIFKYLYFNISNSVSVKSKIGQIKNFVLLCVRPSLHDVSSIKIRYYFLYYFIKPFRILIKFLRFN